MQPNSVTWIDAAKRHKREVEQYRDEFLEKGLLYTEGYLSGYSRFRTLIALFCCNSRYIAACDALMELRSHD